MRKLIVLAFVLSAGFSSISGQSTSSTIEIDDKMQPGLRIELASNTDMAEGTLLQKLKETGYKPETTGAMFWKRNTKDGFYVFNGVQLPDLNNEKLDLYFKVERKSRKEKDISVMSMLVSKGYDNFISAQSDPTTFAAATGFLNGFVANTASYSLQQELLQQEKDLADAEKKMEKLQDEDKSLRKKIEELNADLVNNRVSIEQQAAEVAKLRAAVEALKQRSVKN
ncbi:MAG: hypothetical protein ABWZ25_11150 [Chitinophagaceae bacterium]